MCDFTECWPRRLASQVVQPCLIEITAEAAATNGAAEQGCRRSRGSTPECDAAQSQQPAAQLGVLEWRHKQEVKRGTRGVPALMVATWSGLVSSTESKPPLCTQHFVDVM